MKKHKNSLQTVVLFLLSFFLLASCSLQTTVQQKETSSSIGNLNDYNTLTPEETQIILNKGTDRAFTGEYTDQFEEGIYQCRQCNEPLYPSDAKFPSTCGWPSFDHEIEGAVAMVPDADGVRTEIICSNCKGHLGHIFYGEKLTEKDTRHCVNTTSLLFIPRKAKGAIESAIFAGGCFWGVEYYFQDVVGVINTKVGYTGGHLKNPSYRDVLSQKSGHYEALEITFDPTQTDYEILTKLFFEIHDPTQEDGQGNDIGQQYQSVIFYKDEEQKTIASQLIHQLKDKGLKVATKLKPATKFWDAEDYHQAYYIKEGGRPYCHKYVKRF